MMDKRRIQEVLGMMTKNLECSICLELLKSPVSTKCDHQFCRFCIIQFLNKKRSVPCPLCKKPVTERSIQEREELGNIVQYIRDLIAGYQEDSGNIFTPPKGPLLQCFSPPTPEPLNISRPRSKAKSSKTKTRNQVSGRTRSDISHVPPAESDNDDSSDLPRTVKTSTRRKSNLSTQTKQQNGVLQNDKGNTPSTGLQCDTAKEVPNLCASIIEPSQKYLDDGLHRRSSSDKTKLTDSACTRMSKPISSGSTERLSLMLCKKQTKVTTKNIQLSHQKNYGLSLHGLGSSNFSSKEPLNHTQDISDATEQISLSFNHQNCSDLIINDKKHSETEKRSEVTESARLAPAAQTNIRQSKRKSCEITVCDELLSVLEDGSLGANTVSTQSSFLHVTKDSHDKHIKPKPVKNMVLAKSNMDSPVNTDLQAKSSVLSKGAEELLDHCSILEAHDDFGSRNYSEMKNSSIESNESLSGINRKTVGNSLSPEIIIQNPAQTRKPILIESCQKSKQEKNLAKATLRKKKTRRRKMTSDTEEYEPCVANDDEVIPETIQTDSQIRQTSQNSNISYDIKFYDGPSKDPNCKKSSSSVNQQSTRRMSDRVKKIKNKKDMESPETSCLTQEGVKTPKLVTRTYGKIRKGSLVKKTKEDESWKKIVPSEEDVFPQESEGCDSDGLSHCEDSNATSVKSYSSAFGFNTHDLAKDNVNNLQPKSPANPKVTDKLCSKTSVPPRMASPNRKVAEKLFSKRSSTKQSVPQRIPRSTLSQKGKPSANNKSVVQNDSSTPPSVTRKCTPVSSNGTPLKYGRGKLLPSPFDEFLDTSLLSTSVDKSSRYIPKMTSNNKKVKVKMDAKGKLHMSLESRKSPRSNRSAIKPINSKVDISTARSSKPAPSIIIMDPFEFKSSQTPKDRKRKQVKQRRPAKKSNRLAQLGKKAALEIYEENLKSSKRISKDQINRCVTFAETQPIVIDITQDSTHSDESVLIEDSTSQYDHNHVELIHSQSIQKADEPMQDSNLSDISKTKQKKKACDLKSGDDETCTMKTQIEINKPQSPSMTEYDITCITDSVEEDEAGSLLEKQYIHVTPVSQEMCSGHVHDDSEQITSEDNRYVKSSSGKKQLHDSANQNYKKINSLSGSHTQELFSCTSKKSPYADSIGKTLASPEMSSCSNSTKTINQVTSSPPIDKLCKHGAYYITTEDDSEDILSRTLTLKSKGGVGSASKSYSKGFSTSKDYLEPVNNNNERPDTIQPMRMAKDPQRRKRATRTPVMSEIENSHSSTNESTRPQRKRKSLENISDSEKKSKKTNKDQTEHVQVLKTDLSTKVSNGHSDISTDTDIPKTITIDKIDTKRKTKRKRKQVMKEAENQDQEMLQLMNKINIAEDYDFVFSTQEACSRMDSESSVKDTMAGNHEILNTSKDFVNDIVETTVDNEVNAIEETISDEEAIEDSVLMRRSDEDVNQSTADAYLDISFKDGNNISFLNNPSSLELQKDSTQMNDIEYLNETNLPGEFNKIHSEMDQNGSKGDLTRHDGSPQEVPDSIRSSLIGPSADLIPSLGPSLKFNKSVKENSEEFGNESVNETNVTLDNIDNAICSKAENPNIVVDKDHELIKPSLHDPVNKNIENENCLSLSKSCRNSEEITTKGTTVSKMNICLQIRNPDKDLSTPLLYSPSQCKAGQSFSRSTDNMKTTDTKCSLQSNVGKTKLTKEDLINEHGSDSMPLFSVLELFQPLNTPTDNTRISKPKRFCSSSISKESKRKEVAKKKKARKTRSIQAILRSSDESDQSLNDSVQSLSCIPPTPMVEKNLTQNQKVLQKSDDKLEDYSVETQVMTTTGLVKEKTDKENGYLQLSGAGDEKSGDSCSSKSKLGKKLTKDRLLHNKEKASNLSDQTESASESLLKPDVNKLKEPAEVRQDSRKNLFIDNQSDIQSFKECSNVGLEELPQGVNSDFSGSECSLLKRKRTFSSLRKQSRSGTPSSQNSYASLASNFVKDQQDDLIITENNGVGSSEDELKVRRKKRKCFSLEGSPMSIRTRNSQFHLSNQSSQSSDKSSDPKCPDQNTREALIGLSQLSDTNQNEIVDKIVRTKNSLFTEHSNNEIKESTNPQSSNDHQNNERVTGSKSSQKSDIIMIVDSQNSEKSIESASLKPSKHHSPGLTKENMFKDGVKSNQDCPKGSQGDVYEILSSANPQRQSTSENAETLPPSGLPMEWNKDDFSEDEVIHDTFENENTIKETEIVAKKRTHLKDLLQVNSDDDKENIVEDHNKGLVEGDHCGAGENEKDSCYEVEDDQYADLPLTSSPVMATVLSGLQPCDEEKSDSNIDEVEEDDDDEVLRNVKKKRSGVIESDEDNCTDNESTNMNSSSAFSSQSEVTTQQRGTITSNILKMKEKIKQLEAELAVKGSGSALNDSDSSDSDESDSIRISSKTKKQKEITTIRSSPEIENTKSDDSDSDLFLSPLQYSPPAMESEDDHQLPEVNRETSVPNLLNQHTEQQVDDDDNIDEENGLDDSKKQDLVPSRKDPMLHIDEADESLPPTPQAVSKIRDKFWDKSPLQNQKVIQNNQMIDSIPQTLNEEDRNQDSNKPPQSAQISLEEVQEALSDEFDTCLESEEEMDQAEFPNSSDKNVKSSAEDVADLPDEVKKAMEILQKYKSEVMNSQNSSASKKSNISTPNSNNLKTKMTEISPLVNCGRVSTPSRISLEEIDQTLRDVTPNRIARSRNSIENNSSDSTPIRRISKFSSRKSTPLQSPISSKDVTPSKDSSIIFERKVSQLTAGSRIESPRTLKYDRVIKKTPDSKVSKRITTPSRQTTPGGIQSAENRSVLSMRSPNVPVNGNENLKFKFAASGLSKDQAENVIKLAGLNDCKFYGKINKHTTHLIVKTVSKESRVCERTLKFFQAIAHKIWILSYSWVEESLKAGHLLLENPYEIIGDTVTGDSHYGPSLSRLSQDKLFQNLAIACVGSSDDMSKADMVHLFESLGALVVGDVDTLSCLGSNSQIKKIIVSNKDTMDTELPPEERNCYKNYYSTTGLVTVSREWVLDCISTYKLLSTKNYLFTPRPVRVPF